MIVLGIVVAIVGFVVYEVRADHKVRRSTAGATPVVIVRGLRPRWWRLLLAKAIGFVVLTGAFFGAGLVLWHLASTADPSNVEHSWPMPGATSTPDLTPMHSAPSTSATSGKGR